MYIYMWKTKNGLTFFYQDAVTFSKYEYVGPMQLVDAYCFGYIFNVPPY